MRRDKTYAIRHDAGEMRERGAVVAHARERDGQRRARAASPRAALRRCRVDRGGLRAHRQRAFRIDDGVIIARGCAEDDNVVEIGGSPRSSAVGKCWREVCSVDGRGRARAEAGQFFAGVMAYHAPAEPS